MNSGNLNTRNVKSNILYKTVFLIVTCFTEIRRNWAELETEKYPKS